MFFLSNIVGIFYFILLYSAAPPHEDYMQVDCVLLPRYKKKRKKNRIDRVKKTVQGLKQVKNWSFMKSVDVKIIFVNIYGLCRNWVMNK